MSRRMVVIGTSLGGLTVLEKILAGLPAGFPAPIAIVQHRTKDADDGLRTLLQRKCALPVLEAEDKLPIEPGKVYLAPPDYHLLVDEDCFALSTDAPVNAARPSIDVLFESAAEAYGQGAVGVVLTGLNQDGALGARLIQETGGVVLIQDPATAEAASMPKGALASTRTDRVVQVAEVAPALCALCAG